MISPILTLPLCSKRQLVLARQYARQIAGLLGFNPEAQVEIAARVFKLALQARARDRKSRLQFCVANKTFRVLAFRFQPHLESTRLAANCQGLCCSLPDRSDRLAHEDLVWLVKQLTQVTPVNVFEELEQQNHAYLELLDELRLCQRELETVRHLPRAHVAA